MSLPSNCPCPLPSPVVAYGSRKREMMLLQMMLSDRLCVTLIFLSSFINVSLLSITFKVTVSNLKHLKSLEV